MYPNTIVIKDGKFVCSVNPDHKVIVGYPATKQSAYCHTCVLIRKETAPKCPHCGTPKGFAMGTGDCGCEFDY